MIVSRSVPVDAESGAFHVPAVVGIASVGQHLIVAVEIPGIDAVVGIRPHAAPIAKAAKALLLGAAAACQQQPLGIPGRPGDNVDHAIDRVGAPKCRARTADHLDPINVLEQGVLHVPVRPGEERRVNTAPIHQHQQFVGKQVVESAPADGPVMGIHTRHFQAWNQPQALGNTRHTGATQLLRSRDGDRRRRFGKFFRPFRNGRDLDVHQFLKTEVHEVRGMGVDIPGGRPGRV